MITFALDSNIVTYLLKDDRTIIRRLTEEINHGNDFMLPPVVVYEVRRGLLAEKMYKRLENFEEYCQTMQIGIFDITAWNKAAEIYAYLRQHGKLIGDDRSGDNDILIAAYCLVNHLTLVTNNTRHFERIDGLQFVNWKS